MQCNLSPHSKTGHKHKSPALQNTTTNCWLGAGGSGSAWSHNIVTHSTIIISIKITFKHKSWQPLDPKLQKPPLQRPACPNVLVATFIDQRSHWTLWFPQPSLESMLSDTFRRYIVCHQINDVTLKTACCYFQSYILVRVQVSDTLILSLLYIWQWLLIYRDLLGCTVSKRANEM